ncbi:TonB-dependent receptor [Metallibacterium scheffleri]
MTAHTRTSIYMSRMQLLDRRNPLALACATALMAMFAALPAAAHDARSSMAQDGLGQPPVSTANAQDTRKRKMNAQKKAQKKAVTLNAVIVTGIVGSIENSLQAEKYSNEIVEDVSSEDIGKLPDPSIAESLARLPGVVAERGGDGFSNRISIRGLSSDFVGTLVNGREQATTGENWGVSFNQIPASLVSGATVYLTPDAALIGQGLSGTIDLHTIKPLDYHSRKVVLAVHGQHLTNGTLNHGVGVGSTGDRVSFTYLDQFFHHTLGVAIGVEHSDTPIQEKTSQSWWWSIDNGPGSINTNWGGPYTPGMPNGVVSEEGMQLRAKSEDWKRNALVSIIEWAPSDNFHSSLDLFYSKVDKTRYLNGLQWSSSPYNNIAYSNVGTTPEQPYPVATSGTMIGLAPIMQNEYTFTRYDLLSIGWKNRIKLADQWKATTDLSYSRARENLHDAYAFTGLPNGQLLNAQFTLPPFWGFPTMVPSANLANPGNVAFTDPGNYGYNGRVEYDSQVDRIDAARIDVSHPLGWIFDDAHLGFYYGDRKKTKHANVFFAFLNGNGNGSTTGTYNNLYSVPINSGLLLPPTSLAYGGVGGITNYNVLQALASEFYLVPENQQGDYNRNYTVRLKTPTAYTMLDIDTTLFGIPVRGNVGAQLVHTEQSSTALQTNGNTLVGTLNAGTSYNNFLPSLNLVGNLGDENYLRFGLAKEMVYGLIDDLKASSSASVSRITNGPAAGQVLWSGSGGNPALRPYVAVGADLAWIKYFGRASYFELDVFNKNLLNYIYYQTVLNYNFSNFVNNNPTLTPTSNIGSFTTPENGTGGMMQGATVSGGITGRKISPLLKGFGLQANFTVINSRIPKSTISQIPGGPQTLPGLSRRSASATLYYENGGFSARLAEIYRSSYTGSAVALFDQIGYTKILAYKEADFQIGYAFDSGRYKGLTLLMDVSNLTNSPYRTEQISGLPNGVSIAAPLDFNTWGRTISVGFRYAL